MALAIDWLENPHFLDEFIRHSYSYFLQRLAIRSMANAIHVIDQSFTLKKAQLAQLVERGFCKAKVFSSNLKLGYSIKVPLISFIFTPLPFQGS